jgi:hypothetical protein
VRVGPPDPELVNSLENNQGNPNAVKALIRRGAVLSETDEDVERRLKDMFVMSAFEEINIPLNNANGARVWDILENFAKQRTCPPVYHPPS